MSYIKILLFSILIFANLFLKADCISDIIFKFKIKETSFQILILKGADCANCYIAGKKALEDKILVPRFVVLQDIPKRIAAEFVKESFGLKYDTSYMSFDKNYWECLNLEGTSTIVWVKNGKIVKRSLLKHIFTETIKEKQNTLYNFVDSIDITRYYGGNNSDIVIKGNSLLIYNDIKGRIIELNLERDTVMNVFQNNKPYLLLDSLTGLFVDVKPWRFDYTKSMIKQENGFVNGKVSLGVPYVTQNYIYVPMSTIIVDTTAPTKTKGRDDILYSSLFFGKYDYNWNLQKLIGFPCRTIPNYDTFCNSLSYGHFKNDTTFYCMLGPAKSDSLFAEFNLSKKGNKIPEKFLTTYYPNRLPLFGLSGHYNLYITHFIQIGKMEYYYFSLDNILYSLNGKDSFLLDSIKSNTVSEKKINSFIHAHYIKDNFIYFVFSQNRNEQYIAKYDANNFKFISKTLVCNGNINKAIVSDKYLYFLTATDDAVVVKRFLIEK